MGKRRIIKINLDKCTGCGECIPDCPEGALQLIDGKVRLISDLFCDGLGACIGSCPYNAITIEEREAQAYDEKKVMENIVKQGKETIKAHLIHLRDHNQKDYLEEAIEFLKENNIEVPGQFSGPEQPCQVFQGCVGKRLLDFDNKGKDSKLEDKENSLKQWPIQLHLVPIVSAYFQERDVLLCADRVGYAYQNFHSDYLSDKTLVIACPKLDSNQDDYIEKIKDMIDKSRIETLTVMIMEVPCCRGLVNLVKKAVKLTKRQIPLKCIIVGIKGDIISESEINSI